MGTTRPPCRLMADGDLIASNPAGRRVGSSPCSHFCHKKTNFWDYTAKSKIGQLMDKVRPQFIPDRVLSGQIGKYGDPIRNEPNTLCVETYHDDI